MKTLLAVLMGVALLQSGVAHADDVTLTRSSATSIFGLKIRKSVTLVEDHAGSKPQYSVVIDGLYQRPDWTLMIGKLRLKPSAEGKFRIKTKMKARERVIVVSAIGPHGEIEREELKVLFPAYGKTRAAVSKHSFSAGAGLSFLTYQQDASPENNAVNLSEQALTAKGSYIYRLAPHWDLGVTAFMTTVVFGSTLSSTARFIGLNFRAGYSLPRVREPWRVMLMVGGYYTTMIASSSSYGFENLSGPQIFPVIRRSLSHGDSISTYFKYSPISSGGFGVANLTHRELAIGFSYNKLLENGRSVPFSIDYSNLKTSIQTADGLYDVPVTLNSITLGTGYNF